MDAPSGPKTATPRSPSRTGKVGNQLSGVEGRPARFHGRNARAHQTRAMTGTPTSCRALVIPVDGWGVQALSGAAQSDAGAVMTRSVVRTCTVTERKYTRAAGGRTGIQSSRGTDPPPVRPPRRHRPDRRGAGALSRALWRTGRREHRGGGRL